MSTEFAPSGASDHTWTIMDPNTNSGSAIPVDRQEGASSVREESHTYMPNTSFYDFIKHVGRGARGVVLGLHARGIGKRDDQGKLDKIGINMSETFSHVVDTQPWGKELYKMTSGNSLRGFLSRFNLEGFGAAEEHNAGNDAFVTMAIIMSMLHDKAPEGFKLRDLDFKIVTLDFEGDKSDDGIPEVGLTVVDTRDLWRLEPGTCWSAVKRSYHMIASDLFDSHDRGFYRAKGISFENLPRMNFVHGASAGKIKSVIKRSVMRWNSRAGGYKQMMRTFRPSADSDLEYSSNQTKDWILLRGDLSLPISTIPKSIAATGSEGGLSAADANSPGSEDKLDSSAAPSRQPIDSTAESPSNGGAQLEDKSTQKSSKLSMESLTVILDEEGISWKERRRVVGGVYSIDGISEGAYAEAQRDEAMVCWDLSALGRLQNGGRSPRGTGPLRGNATQRGHGASQRGRTSQRGGSASRRGRRHPHHGGTPQRGDHPSQIENSSQPGPTTGRD